MCVEHIDDLYMSKACVCVTHVYMLSVYMGRYVCVVWGAYAA